MNNEPTGRPAEIKRAGSGWLVLFVLAHFGHHLLSALLTPLIPYIRDEFGLDYKKTGFLLSAFTLTYGLSHLPAGWLMAVFDPRLLIIIGVSGVALSGLLVGISPNYTMMFLAAALMGTASGGYHPSSASLVSSSIEPRRRGWALGVHQIGGTGSHFLAPLIAAGVAAIGGWRGSFIGLSFPVFIFGLFLYTRLGKMGYRRGVSERKDTTTSESQAPISWVRITAFMVLTVVGYALIHAVVSFIPLYLVDRYSVDKGVAAALLSLLYSAGLWAGPLGGYLSDRLGKVPVLLAGSLLLGPAFYLLTVVSYGIGIILVLLAIGACLYARMPVSESYIVGQTSGEKQGTLLGIYYFGSRGGPAVITPVIGYLIDRFDFNLSFIVCALGMVVVTVICGLFLRGSEAR
ncbi:MAG: MFS transporter [Chloroflexota bacterium]